MERDKILEVVEKPTDLISRMVVTGIYLFDNRCFSLIDSLYPSDRDELEVTDLINSYISLQSCDAYILEDEWLDAGTFESLRKAASIFGTE